MHASEARLLQAVGSLYEAAADPERLETLGDTLRRAMGVESGIMFICDGSTGEMRRLLSASANFDTAARRDYAAYYHERNEWFSRAWPRRPPYVARGEELIADDDFARTEFCTDWCSRVGIRHMIGSVQSVGEGLIVGSGIHRARREGAFTDGEKETYALLMGHVGRALQIAGRLGMMSARPAVSLDLVDGLGVGVLLLDREARPLFVNALAERLLAQRRWFLVSGRRVSPTHPASRAAFLRHVAGAADTSAGQGLGAGGAFRVRDPIEGDLPVVVAPFRMAREGFGLSRPAAAVLFGDPDRAPGPPPELLAQAFGLTPAEARIVAGLVRGRTLARIARDAGLSVNTVKTQLASVYAKTGHSRQSALISAVLSDPALRLAPPPPRSGRRGPPG